MSVLTNCAAPDDLSAGWKTDPLGSGSLRFWDGTAWSESIQKHDLPGAEDLPHPPPDAPKPATESIPIFGARKKARALAEKVSVLEAHLDRLGAMSTIEAERYRDQLQAQSEDLAETIERDQAESAREIADRTIAAEKDLEAKLSSGRADLGSLNKELFQLRRQVVSTEDTAMLQEVGVYDYQHPLDDSVAFQIELKSLKDQTKAMARKGGGAVEAVTDWTVNGSVVEGRKMVRDFSKLLLRAYNAEADNLVRGMKPYKLATSIDRLDKVSSTITKLGVTMQIRISKKYHRLRVRELKLTADFINMKAEEKEREKEEKARLREEQKVQQEMQRERARLEKEKTHYENALAKLLANGDREAAERLREEMVEIDKAIEDVDYRAANVSAGYVYVISNIGTFGNKIVKIGLTRRLQPMDRVRELGDASVPFRFDTHALFFSEDAVGIERELHRRFEDRRVNRVNLRREFFYASPAEVKEQLLDVAGEILEYEEGAEALEYRQSLTIAEGGQIE